MDYDHDFYHPFSVVALDRGSENFNDVQIQVNFDKIPSVNITNSFDLKVYFGKYLDLSN